MYKFSFFKKTAAQRYVDLRTRELIQDADTNADKYDEQRKKHNAKEEELIQPFAVHMGDPMSHLNTEAGHRPSKWAVIHPDTFTAQGHSLGQAQEMVRAIRLHVMDPRNGYEEVSNTSKDGSKTPGISPSQYGTNKEISKIAPNGMVGYRLKDDERAGNKFNGPHIKSFNSDTGITDDDHLGPLRRFHQIIDHANMRNDLRKRVNNMPKLNAPDFDPTHPLNLIANYGGDVAIQKIFTDDVAHPPMKPGENLCAACHLPADKHVDKQSAIDHFTKTGEHLEGHHEFRSSLDSVEDRAQSSSLRAALLPIVDEDGNLKFKTQDLGGRVPVFQIGSNPIRLARYKIGPIKGEKYEEKTEPTEVTKRRVCPDCYKGKINALQRENNIPCNDCAKGKINYKAFKAENGNIVVKPHTIGTGGSLLYLDVNDADPCPSCKGTKQKTHTDSTGARAIGPCTACYDDTTGETTGKNLNQVVGHNFKNAGMVCSNHGAVLDPTIRITPDNRCPKCLDDPGFITTKKTVGRSSREPFFHIKVKEFDGNPMTLSRYMVTGFKDIEIIKGKLYSTIKIEPNGPDGYKPADPTCPRCSEWAKKTGKDQNDYRTVDNRTCPCTYGWYDQKDHIIAPTGSKWIHPDHITVPASMYQMAMHKAYKDDPSSNPHSLTPVGAINSTPPKSISKLPEWARSIMGEKWGWPNGELIADKNVLGFVRNGVSVSQKDLESLNKQAAVIRKSPNYSYNGASRELKLVKDFLDTKGFKALPINTPLSTKKSENLTDNSRVDLNNFHPKIQSRIQRVEKVLDKTGLQGEARDKVNESLNKLYSESSGIQEDRERTNSDDSSHWEPFESARDELLKTIGKHVDNDEEIRKEIDRFPSRQLPRMQEV